MNRFNLTFWGEILPGRDPEQVKARFAKLFDISDPERLEHFFTGETIILRRNLDRKVAGEYYHKLHKLGVEAELVKVTAESLVPASEQGEADSEWENLRRQAELEALQRREKDPGHKDRKRQQAAAFKAQRQQEAEALAAKKAAELEARLKQEEEQAEAERSLQRQAEEAALRIAEQQRAAEEKARREAEREAERQYKAAEAARKKAEEDAARKAAEEEARLLREEEAARKREEAEQERQRKAEEATRVKAKQEAERRRKAAEAAQKKAEEEAAHKAAEEEARRLREEEAARKREQAKQERQREAEEAARKKAEQEAERKRKAEQAAKEKAAAAAAKKAVDEEARRLREAEAARKREQAEKERQRKAEEATKKKAEQAPEKQRKAEEAARKKAAQEAERKRKAEQAAKEKAEALAAKKAADEQARRQREAEAARKREQAEKERQRKAEDAARKKAEQAAERKRKAEEAAKRKAAQEAERKRKAEQAAKEKAAAAAAKRAADEETRRLREAETARQRERAEQERQRKAEETARRKAGQEAERKRKAEEAAQRKAAQEAERQRKAEDAARIAAAEAEALRLRREAEAAEKEKREAARRREREETERRARELEENAIERGARALADTSTIKSTPAKVKSRLELPRSNTAYHSGKASASRGAPNLYRVRPFRNSAEVRERATLALSQKRKGLLRGAAALALLLILLGRYISLVPQQPVEGPEAVAGGPGGQLAILAADTLLLHDRSGVSSDTIHAASLGLERLSPPLAYTPEGDLLLTASTKASPESDLQLWRCQLEEKQCKAIPMAAIPGHLSVHSLSGDLFSIDATGGVLSRSGADGKLKASAQRSLGQHPVMRLDSGLLFVNSVEGPAISVLRYDEQAFAQQLDEVLLLPAPALEREQTRVRDFAASGDHWWVTLSNPGNGDSGLYLFDRDWKFLRSLPGSSPGSGRLLNWGNKVLLFDPLSPTIQRYSATGNLEVPLESETLMAMIEKRAGKQRLFDLLWAVALLLLGMWVLACLAWTYLQSARALVYKSRPTQGASPLDDLADDIHWIDALPGRLQQLKHANIAVLVLSLAILILLIGLGAHPLTLVASMIALCGPLIALQLLLRSPQEYLGTCGKQLVLVDHRQLYHLASGARIHYRAPFVLIDDVVVFTGTNLLPALDRKALREQAAPLIQAGVKVDRKTIIIKLLESHHPIARAGQVTLTCLLAGLLLWVLGQLPW